MTKVALIGAGAVAPMYLDALAGLPGFTLAGVLARRANSAQQFIDKHKGKAPEARPYESLTALAGDPSVDFVIVTTPPDARGEIVERLIAAGKPILMEKPVERNLTTARLIVESCEAAGLPLGIMLQHRARPAAKALRARMADLGALAAAEISVPWWRPQSYYDQPGRGTYARDGGGVLITQAIHTLDLALTFLPPVKEVVALSATTKLHRMEGEDFVVAGLTLDGGVPVSLTATTAAYPGRAEAITLHFVKGTARLEGNLLTIAWHDGWQESHGAAAATGSGADPMAFSSDWHRAVIADFAAALADKRPPMVPGRAALKVHALIDAIENAARTGKRTKVPAA